MEIIGAHPYFLSRTQRRKHGRVTLEEGRRVAGDRRSMLRLRGDGERPEGVEIVGYSPRLHEWVFLIVTPGRLLFNGYVVSRDEAEDFKRHTERR